MCEIIERLMEKRSRNDRIECAKTAIADNKYPLEDLARLFKLPLSTIEELAETQKKSL